MTRSEWKRRIIDAYWDEPCPVCGHPANNFGVTSQGEVSQYCEVCHREHWIARERVPSHFDPEPESEFPYYTDAQGNEHAEF